MRVYKSYTYIGIGMMDKALSKYSYDDASAKANTINAKDASSVKTDVDLINEGIYRVLNTRSNNPVTGEAGERVFEPNFGSRLAELVFEPNDNSLIVLAKQFIIEALQRWEPRVSIVDAIVEQDVENHMLKAVIYYVTLIDKIQEGATVVFLQ
jgi:phage baseplate assembly protein W